MNFDKIRRINRITKEMDHLYHRAALKLNLSDSSMMILYTIYDNGGRCLLNEINASGICKQTVNSAIRKMEADDLLYLEQYKGRAKRVVLTEKGMEYAQQTVVRLLAAEEQAFALWTNDEIDLFVQLNQKYLDCLKTQIEEM